MNVNQAAFITTTSLAAVTIGATIAAVSATASTAATIAYAILAITGSAASLASISAWVHTNGEADKSAGKYFENMWSHLGIAIAGTYQFVAHVLIHTVVKEFASGAGRAGSRKFFGPDFTHQEVKG